MAAVRCGLIGYGKIGRLAAEILRAGGTSLELAAIADPSSTAENLPVLHFSDYRKLLASNVQAVIIATPPAMHFDIAIEALRAGKDVWVEKPPSHTAAQVRELARMAEVCGRTLFFAYHARYNPAVVAARAVLAGALEQMISAQYKECAANFHEPGSWVYQEGLLRDSGINVFSVLFDLLPSGTRPQLISVSANQTKAQIHLSGGIRIEMDWEYHGPEVRTFKIQSSLGVCCIELSRPLLTVNGVSHPLSTTCRDVMRAEYEAMFFDWPQRLQTRKSFARPDEVDLLESVELQLQSGFR